MKENMLQDAACPTCYKVSGGRQIKRAKSAWVGKYFYFRFPSSHSPLPSCACGCAPFGMTIIFLVRSQRHKFGKEFFNADALIILENLPGSLEHKQEQLQSSIKPYREPVIGPGRVAFMKIFGESGESLLLFNMLWTMKPWKLLCRQIWL